MRTQTRPYTTEYQRINASTFKPMLTMPLGTYALDGINLTSEHNKFELTESESGIRAITFTINNKPHKIDLSLDYRSASTKLYLNCPYCNSNRESLYAIKTAYACRICIGLHYQSQSERPKDRLLRSIRKNRINLWGNRPNINNLCFHFDREPYKRRVVYYSKLNKLINLEQAYLGAVSAQIERMRKIARY